MKLWTVPIDNASQLIESCRLGSEYFSSKVSMLHGRQWLFRGQANTEWSLVPKIYRSERAIHFAMSSSAAYAKHARDNGWSDEGKCRRWGTIKSLLVWEQKAIQALETIGDEVGAMPEAAYSAKPHSVDYPESLLFPTGSQLREFRSAHFLGQHYGVPTRLLDWTFRPEVALYFALADWLEIWWKAEVSSPVKCESKAPDYCAVFAVHIFDQARIEGLELLYPRRGHNQYMRSQAGAFSIDTKIEERYVQDGKMLGFESLLEPAKSSDDAIIKFEFPRTIVNEAMRKLSQFHPYIRSHIAPSLQSVALDACLEAGVRFTGVLPELLREDLQEFNRSAGLNMSSY